MSDMRCDAAVCRGCACACVQVTWEETDRHKWLGACPTIEMIYDCLYHFVLTCSFTIDVKKSNATQVRACR
jgi:hypothetical protein